jgi:hypothetical protein
MHFVNGVSISMSFFSWVGLTKLEFLKRFNPHILFDEKEVYCKSAVEFVSTAIVPVNE